MRTRPILFSSPMVRALLAGTKTQTRRVIKGQTTAWDHLALEDDSRGDIVAIAAGAREGIRGLRPLLGGVRCPYGVPGDLLWVRETIGRRPASFFGLEATNGVESAFYKADEDDVVNEHDFNLCPWWTGKGLPSIHMPRFASRLTLEITDVRVERLQDISQDDADAECFGGKYPGQVLPELFPGPPEQWSHLSMAECYGRLWESINGTGSWAANPWVWAVSFKVHQQNVDAFLSDRVAA